MFASVALEAGASLGAVVQWIVAHVLRTAVVALLLCALTGCHHRVSPTSASAPPSSPDAPALTITGDPESADGATWTLTGTLEGTRVDLQGILLKPRRRGFFFFLSRATVGHSRPSCSVTAPAVALSRTGARSVR